MKHQIALVGGQLLPVIFGIKEFDPDTIHFLVSSDSKDKIALLKSFIKGKPFSETICNPFDFYSIRIACEKILNKLGPNDQIQLNLTGGTKIMLLAAHSILYERNLNGFYINQDDSLLEVPSYDQKKLTSQLSIKEFLALSGHAVSISKNMNSFTKVDYEAANRIFAFCDGDYRYKIALQHFSKSYKDTKDIPNSGTIILKNRIQFIWSTENLKISEGNKVLLSVSSPIVKNLFFNSSWWELIIAKAVSKWPKAKELLIQSELPFKTDKQFLKNEIDILINIGNKLIFIECKSGKVKQEDINKMKIVKDVYGGIISKSLLVCLEMPSPNIIEKCKELGIEVFYLKSGRFQVNRLEKIIPVLEQLSLKASM